MAGMQHNIGMAVNNQGGMMNLTPMQQQLLQQQQQQSGNAQQQMLHNQQQPQQTVLGQQSVNLGGQITNVATGVPNPSIPNPTVGGQGNVAAEQQKLDHIGKVKNLLWPLKESLANCFKSGAQNFFQNGMIDFGTLKGSDINAARFDKQLEEFYSICDQIELNLQAAISCASQVSSSQRHIPAQVNTMIRQEPILNQEFLSYPTYVGVAKVQVSYVKDVVDALNDAAQNLSND